MKVSVHMEFDSITEMLSALDTPAATLPKPDSVTVLEVSGPGAPDGVDAMPSAIELAAEHNVDLAEVTGTGKDGRITKKDVQSFIDGKAPATPPADPPPTEPPASPPSAGVPEANACREAITRLQEASGLQACLEVLKGFGVQRCAELKPEQRAEFITKCDAAVAMS